MTRLSILLALCLSGCCTIAGGTLGGLHAAHEDRPVAREIAIGAAVGFVADIAIFVHTLDSIPDEAIGGSGPHHID